MRKGITNLRPSTILLFFSVQYVAYKPQPTERERGNGSIAGQTTIIL